MCNDPDRRIPKEVEHKSVGGSNEIRIWSGDQSACSWAEDEGKFEPDVRDLKDGVRDAIKNDDVDGGSITKAVVFFCKNEAIDVWQGDWRRGGGAHAKADVFGCPCDFPEAVLNGDLPRVISEIGIEVVRAFGGFGVEMH